MIIYSIIKKIENFASDYYQVYIEDHCIDYYGVYKKETIEVNSYIIYTLETASLFIKKYLNDLLFANVIKEFYWPEVMLSHIDHEYNIKIDKDNIGRNLLQIYRTFDSYEYYEYLYELGGMDAIEQCFRWTSEQTKEPYIKIVSNDIRNKHAKESYYPLFYSFTKEEADQLPFDHELHIPDYVDVNFVIEEREYGKYYYNNQRCSSKGFIYDPNRYKNKYKEQDRKSPYEDEDGTVYF